MQWLCCSKKKKCKQKNLSEKQRIHNWTGRFEDITKAQSIESIWCYYFFLIIVIFEEQRQNNEVLTLVRSVVIVTQQQFEAQGGLLTLNKGSVDHRK